MTKTKQHLGFDGGGGGGGIGGDGTSAGGGDGDGQQNLLTSGKSWTA